ncbi:MAG: hypothetical protein HYV47_01800 [Candidatus Nealsonbacteria bacterium]|nr:hypothetical protein [Candidatus Nealsonbacteria bacterium]
MNSIKFQTRKAIIISLAVFAFVGAAAYANHSWGNYHWERQSNPFELKLGDNVSSQWDAYLGEASFDWSASSVLDTAIVSGGTNPKSCKAANGRVEVCSSKYGFNGWLGLASIGVQGDHITKGVVKVNDSYFNTATYNTPAWRRLVMCQEIGHTFGLDHQDENFSNSNLGTCMDYTSDPDGPLSNEHPNAHDYEQLEAIYAHLDTVITIGQTVFSGRGNNIAIDAAGTADTVEWGKAIRKDSKGRPSLFVRDFGNNEKAFTFVFWAD